jgi:hypothetical protein
LKAWREVGEAFGFVPVRANENPEVVYLPNIPLAEVVRVLLNAKLRRLQRFAIVTEPTIVLPHLRWKIWRHLFRKIFWLGHKSWAGDFYPRPYQFPDPLKIQNDQTRESLVVFVNANKMSMTAGELYSLRREVLSANSSIQVYGSGWSDSIALRVLRLIKESLIALQTPLRFGLGFRWMFLQPTNYHGVAGDKISETAKYKVALVIENSFELVTEKIFDAWLAGCIPVYVGPNLKSLGLPENLFLQAAPNLASIEAEIIRALALNHAEFLSELTDWMTKSPKIHQWGFKQAYGRVFVEV